MELQAFKARVTGKVQGVLFRDFVKRKASGLHISGTVENKPDRSVEVFAQGTEADLNKLIEHLHKGPFNARVLGVDVEWREPEENLRGFTIVY